MANEQINIDILINASKSAKTLKEQRKALDDLKDGLDEVKYGSGAFELLNEEVNNLSSSMGNLNLKFEDVYGDIQPLTGRIGELEDRMYELALAGQQNTKEFREIQEELVRMKRTVTDVDTELDSFVDRGRGINQVTGAVQGLVGAFNIGQGVVALFGDENQELEETLIRLNAGMSILLGVQEVSNQLTQKGTLLNRAFNLVLKANPVFLLIGALTAVISVYKLWNSATDDSIEKQKELNQQLEEFKRLQEANLSITTQVAEYNLSIAELEGASAQEIYDLKIALLQAEEQTAKDVFDVNVRRINELRDVKDEDLIKERDKLKEENNELNTKLRIDETFLNSFGKRRVLLEKEFNKEISDNQKEVTEIRRQSIIDINKLLRQQIDLQKSLTADITSIGDWNELTIQSTNAIKSFLNSQKEIKETYLDTKETLDNNLKDSLISQEDYNEATRKSIKIYTDSIITTTKLFKSKSIELNNDILDTYTENSIEFSKTQVDNTNTLISEKQRERDEINRIQDERLSKEDLNYQEIVRIESERFNLITQNIAEEKELVEQLNTDKIRVLKEEFVLEKTLLDSQIKSNEFYLNQLSSFIDEQKKLLSSENLTREETLVLEDRLKVLESAKEDTLRIEDELTKELRRIRNKVKDETIKIEKETIDGITKLNKIRVDETLSAWDFIKKYIKENPIATAEAFSQVFTSSLQSIDSFLTSYENRRISFIQQETDLKLEAIDVEKQAFLDSITQQTNAEKFKADKLKEFDDKAAVEEKKRDKEIAEAQYKGEIRKWEYSYLEAIVNLGKSLLGAASNPFQLAVVGALGVTQLATIQGNKPQPPQFGMGGMIDGPSHNGGGVDINAEGGEVIINKKSSAAFLPILDSINQAYGGTPLMNTNVMANGGIVGGNSSIDTSNLENIVSQILNRPIKTYVVSGDMTSQQNSDMVLKNRTSF